ncbi:MAG: adenine nucleotide alpha hydrolase [Rhodobacterales bacterium]|nr:adenine nucleotide alpha hydrolase [Rhodobacterales bacterium]
MLDRPDPPYSDTSAEALQARLVDELRRHDGLTIAVSGGIDSMTLAYVAHRFGGRPVRVAHAVSPAVPPLATERVKTYAAREGWTLNVIEAGEFADPAYRANPVNRCYFCKSHLYDRIRELTDGPIASGANADDLGDYRPGLEAAAERGIVHPFVAAGIDKAGIRAIARHHGLNDISELPAQPCLASRVETGIGIEAGDLAFIDAMERTLRHDLAATETVRCRLTHAGVVIEVGAGAEAAHAALAATAARLCSQGGRPFAGVRAYRRGSAFLRSDEA